VNKPGARNYTFCCTAARSYMFGVDGRVDRRSALRVYVVNNVLGY
jgi:hypothetical protein